MIKQDVFEEKCIFAPSLICFDLCNLEQQAKMLEDEGVRVLHVDIIDGQFSPSMPLGLDTVRQLRKKTDMLFDVHLMATEQDFFIDELLSIGVQQITFHIECEKHVDRQINRIKDAEVRAGVALKPSTDICGMEYILEKCDVVLLMLINPGYAGMGSESQVPYAGRKIRDLRNMIKSKCLDIKIEIDGRVSLQDIEMFAPELVDIFVTGSTCIDRNNIKSSFKWLREIRQKIIR